MNTARLLISCESCSIASSSFMTIESPPSPQKHPGRRILLRTQPGPPPGHSSTHCHLRFLTEHRRRGGRLGLAAAIVSESILLSIARTRKLNFRVITYGAWLYSLCAFYAFLWHLWVMSENFDELTTRLAAIAKDFHGRGWLLGTSGNLSAVVSREPLHLAMSPSGVDKGELTPDQILLIDEHGLVVSDKPTKPSDESPIHVRIAKARGAGAVLHTHSIWNTILSEHFGADGGIAIEGFEMLKGLQGVRTHEHREWLPIIENSQDMPALANTITAVLNKHQDAHGFLLKR